MAKHSPGARNRLNQPVSPTRAERPEIPEANSLQDLGKKNATAPTREGEEGCAIQVDNSNHVQEGPELVRGVNYEGGKITLHALRHTNCVFALNAQAPLDSANAASFLDTNQSVRTPDM